MTQKKIGDDLYIFKQEAYEITADTDASKIFVQLELFDAFKTLNEDLASKIVPINYNLFQVTKPIYADYIYADDPEPEGPTDNQGPTGDSGTTGTTGTTGTSGESEGGETPEVETPTGEPSTAEIETEQPTGTSGE